MISKRERYLAGVVATIVGGYVVFLIVRGLFLGPLESQAAQIRGLISEYALKKKQLDEATTANAQLTEWESRSLPGDEGVAQALYQDYLFKLMRDCHFDDESQVAPDKTQKFKTFNSIQFTIRGRVSLENLTQFLYRLRAYDPQVLHQVRGLTISRTEKSKNLTVTMTVAAMSLENAPHRGGLIGEGDEPRKVAIEGVPLEKFQRIAQKNIFEPFREPAPPSREPDKPQVDPARYVVFSGYSQSGSEPEAWIYDRLNHENRFLHAGDDLAIAGLKGKIVSVAASSIVLEMDNKEWSLKLGKNLRELKEIGQSVAKTQGSDATESAAPVEGEKPTEGSPPDAAGSGEATSNDKPDKIRATIPVKQEAGLGGGEVTKADGDI